MPRAEQDVRGGVRQDELSKMDVSPPRAAAGQLCVVLEHLQERDERLELVRREEPSRTVRRVA